MQFYPNHMIMGEEWRKKALKFWNTSNSKFSIYFEIRVLSYGSTCN